MPLIMSTTGDLIKWATSEIAEVSESPRLDSELLLAAVISSSRINLHAHPECKVSGEQDEIFREFIARRKQRESVASITGRKEFFGLEFAVNSRVLVPRPETEQLVELALGYCRKHRSRPLQILDLGTGSGCISVALAYVLMQEGIINFQITAVDISKEALIVAQKNAATHTVFEKIEFIKSNWFSSLEKEKTYDLILSNPPYIAEGKKEELPDISHEPEGALFSGKDGFRDIALILNSLPDYLAKESSFFCEIDSALVPLIEHFYKSSLKPYRIHKDLAGKDRVLEVG